jgi:MFS family permease
MALHPPHIRNGIRSLRARGERIRDRWKPRDVRAPSLDWLNFLIADVRGGLGPYIVVFLVTELGWTPSATGFVTTIGGWFGLAAQAPIGAWLDRTSRKRAILLWLC